LVARGRSGLSATSGPSSAGPRIALTQSTSFGPSAVMIMFPGLKSVWQSPSPGGKRSISARISVAMRFGELAVVVP